MSVTTGLQKLLITKLCEMLYNQSTEMLEMM